ncbi:ankyrin repeat-containing domain protein [Aspergillus granulosus]|uniref:Ankyrin repeat-containing domain protein n=1 Tax=Aspergillus granulosus TaxID=176169 RepID=A0ABR4HGV4_9EURO
MSPPSAGARTLPLEIYLLVFAHLSPQDQLSFLRALPQIAPLVSPMHVTSRDANGDTILHFLARDGRDEAALFNDLVSSHPPAVLHLQNNSGVTPLMYTAANWNYSLLRILLEKDPAGLNISDDNGSTALFYALDSDFDDGVDLLLAQPSIDVNCTRGSRYPETPLLRAIDMGSCDVAKALIRHPSIDVNWKSEHVNPALVKAISQFERELAEFMILNRPDLDVNAAVDGGLSALDTAILLDESLVYRLLLEQDSIDADRPGSVGKTPLAQAVLGCNIEAMELLLARSDVDVNRVDNRGRSALSYAVEISAADYVRLLLEHGARPDLEDHEGRTPISRAAAQPPAFKHILALLEAVKDVETSVVT